MLGALEAVGPEIAQDLGVGPVRHLSDEGEPVAPALAVAPVEETTVRADWAVEDVGRVLNPLLVEGQLHGGVAQGLGQVLFEDIRFDDDGQLVTGSFMDYPMPRADDMPHIRSANPETPTQLNPLGVKGVGEAGTVGSLAAGMNAICNALLPAGIRHIDMPATPLRVWQALQQAGFKI